MDEFHVVVMDVDGPLAAIGIAWLAILVGLVVTVLRDAFRAERRQLQLPFFRMLERRGLSSTQVVRAVGLDGFIHATERCANCPVDAACRRALYSSWLGFGAPSCPNDELFERVARRQGGLGKA